MQHPGARRHALHVAWARHLTVAHVIFMFHFAFQHVGDNLHIPVGVSAKALAAYHAVFIDDA
jgi:hypothetical protein